MFREFFFRRPATLESAATYSLLRGGGLGRGHSPNGGNLSQYPNRPNTSLAACCPLSSSLPRGRGRGSCWDEGFCKENRLCRLLFIFQTTCINGCKPKLLFKPPETAKPAATRSLPRGGGWGEGILRISATFHNTLTLTVPIQTLRFVALSLTLSHGREDGAAVGIKGSARKTGCAGCFLLFRRPFKRSIQAAGIL